MSNIGALSQCSGSRPTAERRHYQLARELADAPDGVGDAERGALFRLDALTVSSDCSFVLVLLPFVYVGTGKRVLSTE